ncbi:hypothetical protein M422DRAFT_46272 [Sphaerobolus stellatus SS14]|uniref:Chitin synthase export chaperone n=1 Tax=Sphaerobolus stellatus (strain SS14) TaxID=990650 RepID=A0A0C9VGV8_SPHS4|nr:hypothetical protein M422DRAFT_46272 [Sphaerobolus stellatus SS14]
MDTTNPFEAVGAGFLGTTLDSAFYGVQATLFVLFIAIHHYQGKKNYKRFLNVAMVVLFVFCTIFWALDVALEYYSLTNIRQEEQNILAAAFTVVYGLIDFTTQIIFIYRCWTIWQRKYIVTIVPLFLAVVSFACVCTVAGLIFNFKINLIPTIQGVGDTGFAVSLVVDVYVTSFILGKIRKISKEFEELNLDPDRPHTIIMAMFLESGLVMVIPQLIWLVLFILHNVGYEVASNPITQIYAITPTILMIRIALGVAYDAETMLGTIMVSQSEKLETQELTEVGIEGEPSPKSDGNKSNYTT